MRGAIPCGWEVGANTQGTGGPTRAADLLGKAASPAKGLFFTLSDLFTPLDPHSHWLLSPPWIKAPVAALISLFIPVICNPRHAKGSGAKQSSLNVHDFGPGPRGAGCVRAPKAGSVCPSPISWRSPGSLGPGCGFGDLKLFPCFAAWWGFADGCSPARYLSPAPCICTRPYLPTNTLPMFINWEHF